MKRVICYGTFDLFHIGHLNFIKRARALGDYLIVGVSTNEFNALKGKQCYIPYEQRKQIVEALSYVDEVIPEETWEQKVDDIKKYNIDVVVTVEEWKDRFEYLKQYAEVVYLKPTPNISTTQIKKDLVYDFVEYKKKHRLKDSLNKYIFIYPFKYLLKLIYFFMKFLKTVPNKVVFISRRSNRVTLEYQMYLNALKENNIKTVVLCKKMKKGILGCIAYLPEIFKQMYHLATSKVCVLDTYCIPASILTHKKDLKIIQTWHALMAVKQFGYQNLDNVDGRDSALARILDMHKNYDYVVSGSKVMNTYFAKAFNTDINKIHEIGSPTVDYLLQNKSNIKDKIYDVYHEFKTKPNVLYVPTFRKGKKINDFDLINNFDYDNYNLIIKYHPLTKNKITEERVYQCPEFTSFELLTIADYIITDYSSIMAEASLFDKPLLFYVYDLFEYQERNGLNINLYKEMPGCVFTSALDLLAKIKANDFNHDDITKFRNKYVNNVSGNTSLLLKDYILANLGVGYETKN